MQSRPTGGPLRKVLRFMSRDLIWWLSPILVLFVLAVAFLVVVEGSSLSPLIYSMF